MAVIRDTVSRVRTLIKANTEDAFVTDRFIYSEIAKYAHMFIKRDNVANTIINFNTIIKTLPCVELIEVDKVSDTCCATIRSGCKIKRTKEKIPHVVECRYGPIFRSVTTLDNSNDFTLTTPSTFNSIIGTTTFKYNKTLYFWYINGYLYFPNVDFDYVKVEGIFEDSIDPFVCDDKLKCIYRQDDDLFIPDYLLPEIEQLVIKDLIMRIQVPAETSDDKQNINR